MSIFLPDSTRLSQVHLRIANLGRALRFYQDVLGLNVLRNEFQQASLTPPGRSDALIILTEQAGAVPRPLHTTGLYHFALRYPLRGDLASVYRRLMEKEYSIAGASDHEVSEAIYLSDPDGNGIELYVDRPRSKWLWQGNEIAMTTKALDLEGLLAAAGPRRAGFEMPKETEIGHIHLNVADLAVAERFYREFLGFTVTQRSYPGALFFAAGGYHHHIGVNTWAGGNTPPTNSVGIISYRLEVPVTEVLYCLSHRAPLLGYEINLQTTESERPLLKIKDPNGIWQEIVYSNVSKLNRENTDTGKALTNLHEAR